MKPWNWQRTFRTNLLPLAKSPQDFTVAQPTRLHSGTAHKTSQWHSPQDFTVAQPTRLHSGTAHKTSQWNNAQEFTVAQPTRLHSDTAHKTSQWHSPQDFTMAVGTRTQWSLKNIWFKNEETIIQAAEF